MSSTHIRSHHCFYGLALVVMAVLGGTPVRAQQPGGSAPDVPTVTGGMTFANRYMFRGVRQNSDGLVMSPFVAVTATVLSAQGSLRSIELSAGSWNSLHRGDTGSGGPIARPWYESRGSGTIGVRFARGFSLASTYTAYVSPNDAFTTVKEVSFRVAVDDRGALGRAAAHPYGLLAVEIDAAPGMGQVDGGRRAGTYLELGAAPGYSGRRASVAFPVKVGLSLGDFYELGDDDHAFGFASVGGTVTVPFGPATKAGQLTVQGGLELQRLGETTRVFNGGERSALVASLGFALTR